MTSFSSDIMHHPKTTVALIGDNVTFVCAVEEVDGSTVVFNDSFVLSNINRTEYGERGIYWESTGGPIKTFYVYILANEVNNGTSLSCGSGACQTDKAFLIVVNGNLTMIIVHNLKMHLQNLNLSNNYSITHYK